MYEGSLIEIEKRPLNRLRRKVANLLTDVKSGPFSDAVKDQLQDELFQLSTPEEQQILTEQKKLLSQLSPETKKIDLINPVSELFWGIELAAAYKSRKEKIMETPLWKALTINPAMTRELRSTLYSIHSTMGNSRVKVRFSIGEAPSFCFIPQENVIQFDVLWGLIDGLEHVTGALMHEVGHSKLTLESAFKPVSDISEEMVSIKRQAAQQHRSLTEDEYRRLASLSVRAAVTQELIQESENNVVNRYAANQTRYSVIDLGYALNMTENLFVDINKTGPVDNAQKQLVNLARMMRYAFYKNNRFFEDMPEWEKAIGIDPTKILALSEDGKTMLNNQDSIALLQKLCRRFEEAQPSAVDRLIGRFERVAARKQEERNRVLVEIVNRFAKPMIDELTQQKQQQIDQIKEMMNQMGQSQMPQNQNSQSQGGMEAPNQNQSGQGNSQSAQQQQEQSGNQSGQQGQKSPQSQGNSSNQGNGQTGQEQGEQAGDQGEQTGGNQSGGTGQSSGENPGEKFGQENQSEEAGQGDQQDQSEGNGSQNWNSPEQNNNQSGQQGRPDNQQLGEQDITQKSGDNSGKNASEQGCEQQADQKNTTKNQNDQGKGQDSENGGDAGESGISDQNKGSDQEQNLSGTDQDKSGADAQETGELDEASSNHQAETSSQEMGEEAPKQQKINVDGLGEMDDIEIPKNQLDQVEQEKRNASHEEMMRDLEDILRQIKEDEREGLNGSDEEKSDNQQSQGNRNISGMSSGGGKGGGAGVGITLNNPYNRDPTSHLKQKSRDAYERIVFNNLNQVRLVELFLRKFKEKQFKLQNEISNKHEILPSDSISERLNTSLLKDLIVRQKLGMEISMEDRKIFRINNPKKKTPIPIDIIIGIDASGSMEGRSINSALTTACILYEAAHRNQMNVFVDILYDDVCVEMANPETPHGQIASQLATIDASGGSSFMRKGLKKMLEQIAKQKKLKKDELVGDSHIFIITDGGFSSENRLVSKFVQELPSITLDFCIIGNDPSPIEDLIRAGEKRVGKVNVSDSYDIAPQMISLLKKRLNQTILDAETYRKKLRRIKQFSKTNQGHS